MTILTHPRTTTSPQPRATMTAPAPHRRMDRGMPMTGSIDPIRVLRRYLWAIVAAGFVGGLLGTAAFFILRETYPLYSGSVVFEITPGLQKSSDVGNVDLSNDDMVYRVAQTETFMLTSRNILEAALRDPDVQRTKWAQPFYVKGTFSLYDALDDLEDTIGTGVRRSSNLFSLHWSAHEPRDVPTILNAIARAYMDARRLRDFEIYDKNAALFNSQLDTTQRQLQTLDTEMKSLITATGMTTLDDTRWSAQFHQMEELQKTFSQLSTNLHIAQSSLNLVHDQIRGRVEPSPEDRAQAEDHWTVVRAREVLQSQKTWYGKLLMERNADNAMVREAENLVNSAQAELDRTLQEIMVRNLQAKATEFENQVTRLQAAVEENQLERERQQELLKSLAAKQSELEMLKSQREYLQEKRQADMQLINEVNLMRMRLDAQRVKQAHAAYTPREPSFPKPEVVIPLGVLGMIGLTIGLIFLRELLDQRVKSASDLAVLPGAHVLGSLPDASDDPTKILSPELVVRRQPTSVLAESYRQAATTILPQLEETESQTLLLVGGLPEAGTTTVATNLAAAAAATGKSVLLVDANFRRPGLGKAMGVNDDSTGLGDVLNSSASLEDAIHDTGEGVSVMPAGSPANRVFERLNNGVIDGVLADLRTRFDLIIFDTPPAVVAGDAMMLANKVDAAVMVIRANQEHRGLVARMINRLADARCLLIGVLLNRPRGIAGGYLKKNYAAMAGYSRNGSAA